MRNSTAIITVQYVSPWTVIMAYPGCDILSQNLNRVISILEVFGTVVPISLMPRILIVIFVNH